MLIMGCDYHPGFQQIAYVDTETGEVQERRLGHQEEAEKFYRDLATRGVQVRVGMEASGHARWFERLLGELKFELWMGDAAKIKAKRVRKQRTDRLDAQQRLRLVNGKLSIRSRMGLGTQVEACVPLPGQATHKRAPRPETPAPTPLNPGVAVLPSSPSTPQSLT
jgi:hypothetical protein